MSQLRKRTRQAASKGVMVFRWPGSGIWDIYVVSEGPLGPRGFTKHRRDAVNHAYRIAMSYGRCKVQTVEIVADPL